MLHDFQQAMKAALLGPPGAALPADMGDPQATGFAIHRNTVLGSLAAVLAAAHPTVRTLVGDGFFESMAVDFIRAEPPSRPQLLAYGEGFAPYIATYAPAAALPYLADVAAHDWARTTAFHAADTAPFDGAALVAAIQDGAGELFLSAHPSAQLIGSAFPLYDIWAAHQADGAGAEDDLGMVDLAAGSQDVLVVRRDDEVLSALLGPGDAILATELMAGRSLLSAAEFTAEIVPGFELEIALRRFLALGLFVGFRLETG